MQRRAFTLIELLVVIAIIAILASILFPVFAQAKLAAKKTSDLSNVKEEGLAVLMYYGDFDGQFPLAFEGTNPNISNHPWTGEDLWQQRMMPYVKNVDIFGAKVDAQAGETATVGSWAGVGVSFAANSYYGNWCCAPNWGSGFELRGPMGVGDNTYPAGSDEGYGWLMSSSLNETMITQPAGTILLAEKTGPDIASWNTTYEGDSYNFQGNFSAFSMGGVIGGNDVDDAGWGPEQIPNGKQTLYLTVGNKDPLQFEYGINGAVSAPYAGNSVFVFTDGHAKAMIPSSTNPDPVNLPQSNLWDGKR